MKRIYVFSASLILVLILILIGCKNTPNELNQWEPYNEAFDRSVFRLTSLDHVF